MTISHADIVSIEFITDHTVRLIAWQNSIEYPGSRDICEILEMTVDTEEKVQQTAKLWAKDLPSESEIMLPLGLELSPRITSSRTKIERIIQYLVRNKK